MGRFLHRGMVNSPDVVDKLLEGLSLGRGWTLGVGMASTANRS